MCNPLHPCQHTDWVARLTETTLYNLTDIVRNAIETKEIELCPFLDFEERSTTHAKKEETSWPS